MLSYLRVVCFISLFSLVYLFTPALAETKNDDRSFCGYSPIHELKYSSDSKNFSYVEPDALKGGQISVGRVGYFDSLNFLRYPGTTISDRKQIPLHIDDYLFDSFLVQSSDEVAGFYCLAAKKIIVAKDYSEVSFILNPNARFHDGKPLSVDDVVFTFEALKKQGHPYYRQVLRNVTLTAFGENGVTYKSNRKGDKKFVSVVGTLPLHPKHFWENGKLNAKTMVFPLGSGPYKISKVSSGKFVLLEREKKYWARDHFTQKGRYNFDQIKIDYFRDQGAALEAFKGRHYDVRVEKSALEWQKSYNGKAIQSGDIKRHVIKTNKPGDLYFLAFNQRRLLFKNRNVRKAFALLYDFEQTNKILFHGLHSPIQSIYGKSSLAASGAASEDEKNLLKPFMKSLPSGLLNTESPQDLKYQKNTRKQIRAAVKLLDEAKIVLKDGLRIDPQTGKPLKLEVAYLDLRHRRILLNYAEKLKAVGIQLVLAEREAFAARKKVLDHEFDMVVLKWSPELLPGTSEGLLWGSPLADVKGSYALAGVKDPVLDFAIGLLRGAKSWDEMTKAAKIFDRVFRWQIHAVPLWQTNETWVAYWDKFSRPLPSSLFEVTLIDLWWAKDLRQTNLKQSETTNK